MKTPNAIRPDPVPGPDYDPMDWIIQDLENVESFLDHLRDQPKDLNYLKTHLSGILRLRRTLSQHLDLLSEEPYHYTAARLKVLHAENERLFIYLEGVVGAIDPWEETKFKKCLNATEEALLKFDEDLTP